MTKYNEWRTNEIKNSKSEISKLAVQINSELSGGGLKQVIDKRKQEVEIIDVKPKITISNRKERAKPDESSITVYVGSRLFKNINPSSEKQVNELILELKAKVSK